MVGTCAMPSNLAALDTTVAGDNLAAGVDQHRVGEAELANAVSDLPQLPI
jgi:hypothetical protein